MAHAITNTNGFNEMAYVGEKPWHGLGQELTAGAPLEKWEEESGMLWKVRRSKVRYQTGPNPAEGQGSILEWPERHVLFRSDNGKPLGLVSDRYQVVQPREVLAFFADIAKNNGLQLETAGTLHGGKQYWAMARTGQDFMLGGKDRLSAFVLLATSCDGSTATVAKFSAERVVCANTLHIALHDGQEAVRVKHSTTFNADAVRIELGLAEKAWDEFTADSARLASRPLNNREALKVLMDTIGDYAKFQKDMRENRDDLEAALKAQPNFRQMASIMDIFRNPVKMRGASILTQNTAWGLVNSATQFYDHDYGRSADARLSSAWLGQNGNKKESIFNAALALCE